MLGNRRIFRSFARSGGNFTSSVVYKNPWLIKRRYFPCPDGQRRGNYGFCVGLPYGGVYNVESKVLRGNKRNSLIPCILRYPPGVTGRLAEVVRSRR